MPDESQDRDLQLFVTGMFIAHGNEWQCHSVIVANDGPIRHFHNCCDELGHDGAHECGCGEKWWYTGEGTATPETCWYSGPLTKVTFGAHNTDPRPGWEVYGGTGVVTGHGAGIAPTKVPRGTNPETGEWQA